MARPSAACCAERPAWLAEPVLRAVRTRYTEAATDTAAGAHLRSLRKARGLEPCFQPQGPQIPDAASSDLRETQ